MARKRARLSWKDKYAILRECRRRGVTGGYHNIMDVCDWASRTLELNKKPAYRTVLSIIRDENRVEMKARSTHCEMKAELIVSSTRIENVMIEWVWHMSRNEEFICDAVIIEKARRVQEYFNSYLPPARQSNRRFTKGWLWRFKKTKLV